MTDVAHEPATLPGLPATPKKAEPFLNKYFKTVIELKVSDLHLKANVTPHVRMKGDLRPLTGGPLTGDQIREGIFELLNPEQMENLPFVKRWLSQTGSVRTIIQEKYGHLSPEARG